MNNNVHFGDGVLDEAKADVNNRAKGLSTIYLLLLNGTTEH